MPFHLPTSCHLLQGEVFASIEACEQRLRGFALAEGLDTAHTGGGNKRVLGGRWQYGHRGKETWNWRKLENRVEVNEERSITSRHKRDGISVGSLVAIGWCG